MLGRIFDAPPQGSTVRTSWGGHSCLPRLPGRQECPPHEMGVLRLPFAIDTSCPLSLFPGQLRGGVLPPIQSPGDSRMTLRLFAALTLAALLVGTALAEKKKLPNAPETVPAPVVAPPVSSGITLPSPDYLKEIPPQYFPEPPAFPLPRELASQEDAAAMLKPQVAMELKIVTVSDTCFKQCGLECARADCCESRCKSCPTDKPAVYLPGDMGCAVGSKTAKTEAQICCLTPTAVEKLLRAGQEDSKTCVCAAPTITTESGEAGQLRVGKTETFVTSLTVKKVNGDLVYVPTTESHDLGITLSVKPTVSADGKSVTLCMDAVVRELGVLPVPTTPVTSNFRVTCGEKKGEVVPFTHFIQEPKLVARKVCGTVCVPDGGTAVFYGGKATIERPEKDSLTVLADAPAVTGMFACDKTETTTNHLLVLVTARVVKSDAIEQCAARVACDLRLPKLLADYTRACKENQVEEARRLAIECLAIDPTCFGKK